MDAISYNDEWILEHYYIYPDNKALCEEYNRVFNTNIKYNTFKSHLNRELKMNGKRNELLLYTEEQKEWLKVNYHNYGNYCFDEFNKTFNSNRTKHALSVFCKKQGFRVDKDVSAMHQLGNTKREKQVGDIWKSEKTGFWYIKVAKVKRNQYASIKRYHRYLWETEHGEIPKGYKVIFLDGDADNCQLSNLACVPCRYLAWMNKYGMKSEEPVITQTAIKWCELKDCIEERN